MAKIVDFNAHSEKQAKKRNLLPWLLAIAVVLGAGLFILQNAIRIKEIIVVGNVRYSSEEVVGMIGIEEEENILQVYFNRKELLEDHPYLERVEISFVSYNQVRIDVVEKDVIGGYRYMGKYLCIDKDGYIIASTDELQDGVPLIKGITVESFVDGEPLAVKDGVLGTLLTLHQLQNKYSMKLDIIDFRYAGVTDILLGHGKLLLFLGTSEQLESKIEKASQILAQVGDDTDGYVDLTNPDGRVILKKFNSN